MPRLGLNDGAQIDYYDAGDGVPVLFIHGWGMNRDAFWSQEPLSKHCRVIIPSMRGCGKSSVGNKPMNIQTIGEDIFEFANILGLKNYILVGWSMGALAVWQVAGSEELGPINSFVSIDMTPKMINNSEWSLGLIGSREFNDETGRRHLQTVLRQMRDNWQLSAQRMAQKIPSKSSAKSLAQSSTKSSNAPKREKILERLIAIASENNSVAMANLWEDMIVVDTRDKLKDFNVEAHVLRGLDNALYDPAVGEYVNDYLPFSTLYDFAFSGHAPHLEEADKFNDLVISLVNKAENGNQLKASFI